METLANIPAMIFGPIGLTTPLRRFLFTSAGGTMAELMIKPPWAFDESGKMRPWAMPFGGGEVSPGCTFTPLGFFPILLGIILSLFL